MTTETATTTLTLSFQQQIISDEFERGTRNGVVVARAGCGKTFIIIRGVVVAPERNILVCAFSKIIQVELEKRITELGIKGKVTAKTLHALGLAMVKRFWPDVRVNYSDDRAKHVTEKVCGVSVPDPIKKLITKLHTQGRIMAPHARTLGQLTDILYRFECDPDEGWAAEGFGPEFVELKALEAMELAASTKPVLTGIDGADMLFLPVRNRWVRPTFDMVVVDEGQDMNAAQLELARGACKGRMFVVGDNRQAIFGFAGADSGSLARMGVELNAVTLPLTTTYRCGKAIVAKAAAIVPDFEAGEGNPEGEVLEMNFKKMVETAGPSDFVLSRTNAPLVPAAMALLRAGKRTRIAGRDIGKGLVTLVKKFKARSVPELLDRIGVWEGKEVDRLVARFKSNPDSPTLASRLEGVHEQAAMLTDLAEGSKSVQQVIDRVEELFDTDGKDGAPVPGEIVCSSVHRAKGLESNRVFILAHTLRSNNEEEDNIRYVAITRAKQTLVMVN